MGKIIREILARDVLLPRFNEVEHGLFLRRQSGLRFGRRLRCFRLPQDFGLRRSNGAHLATIESRGFASKERTASLHNWANIGPERPAICSVLLPTSELSQVAPAFLPLPWIYPSPHRARLYRASRASVLRASPVPPVRDDLMSHPQIRAERCVPAIPRAFLRVVSRAVPWTRQAEFPILHAIRPVAGFRASLPASASRASRSECPPLRVSVRASRSEVSTKLEGSSDCGVSATVGPGAGSAETVAAGEYFFTSPFSSFCRASPFDLTPAYSCAMARKSSIDCIPPFALARFAI